MKAIPTAVALALACGVPAAALGQGGGAQPIAEATAKLKDPSGKAVGEVRLVQRAAGVVLHAELEGLPPGWHAFHVHETGKCEPDFKAAGGHFNPTDAQHGLDKGGPHAGDLPNFWADDQGRAKFDAMTSRFTLNGAAQVASAGPAASSVASLFDDDGSALMVHAKPDDYTSEPSGAAGDRLACGVVVAE